MARAVFRFGRYVPRVEELESRLAPAAVRLDLVALHELGHSLGLEHSSDPSSIMYAYYNPSYDLSYFTSGSDPAVGELQALYAAPNSGPWKDSLDPSAGNGVVDLTYSFMPDGVKMDQGAKSSLFSTFNRLFGSPSVWKPIFAEALNRWSSASNGLLSFSERADTGKAFNYSGKAQNDPGSGDIRITTHRMDGPGKVLAHAYFPPPNGATAAGDAHFDQAERWSMSGSSMATEPTGAPTGRRNLAFDNAAEPAGPAAPRHSNDTVETVDAQHALALALLRLGRLEGSMTSTTSSPRLPPMRATSKPTEVLRASHLDSSAPRGSGLETPIRFDPAVSEGRVPRAASDAAAPHRDAAAAPEEMWLQPMAQPGRSEPSGVLPPDPIIDAGEADSGTALQPLTALALTLLGGFCVQPEEPQVRQRHRSRAAG